MLPLTEVSPQPSAIPGGNQPGDWQSAVGWGDIGPEPRTAGQQSCTLPLSHHASCMIHYTDKKYSVNHLVGVPVGLLRFPEKKIPRTSKDAKIKKRFAIPNYQFRSHPSRRVRGTGMTL
jgi:hypothetical protein